MSAVFDHKNEGPVSLNDLIARDKSLTTFIDAYRRYPELVDLLEDTSNNVTVIAVTNEAFKALEHIPPEEELKRRIKRHFLVNFTADANQPHIQQSVNTLSNEPAMVTVQNGRVHMLEGAITTLVTELPHSVLYKTDILLS
ncbi:hypothetical protein BDF19DRAFT_170811 [Syncephalis fuscata]|nr:hypothetical protein BDF19DRAFT_170811 [Syncephalis fuscata]